MIRFLSRLLQPGPDAPAPSPAATPGAADSYRAVDILTLPAGGSMDLVHALHDRTSRLMPSALARALVLCRAFAPLDDHARTCCRELGLDPSHAGALRDQLGELVQAGLLVGRGPLLARCAALAGASAPASISTLGLITRDRPRTLARALDSYADRLERFGRRAEVVVIDQSLREDETRALLEARRGRPGPPILHAGPRAIAAFGATLARQAGVDPALVRFALGDVEGCGLAPGAARNALLLHTVSEMLFSADDDTLGAPAAPPDAGGGVVCGSDLDPTEFWFFSDRDRALAATTPVDEDLLAMHERWLGRGPGAAVAAVAPDDVELGRMSPRFVRHLLTGAGRVRLSLNGLAGDSGMASPRYYLQLAGPSRGRLLASASAYRAALQSREVVRSVRRVTLNDGRFCMTTFFGLDHRDVLPPFFPVLRNEDAVFGQALRICVADSYTALLPRVLRHEPEEPRAVPLDFLTRRPGLSYLLMACTAAFEPGPALDARQALEELGRHLAAVAALPPRDFEEYLRLARWREASADVAALERRLQAHGGQPPYWADDVLRLRDHLHDVLPRPEYVLPRDLGDGRDDEAVRALTRRLIGAYGGLLEAWPALEDAARALRGQGRRLAEPVG
jgi:hypothetical protein